jgi:o-succinylbenzoate synthase
MKYRFEFRPYHRQFKQPLATSHGLWEVREGIILRLTDETGKVGFGEIAPLTWFGSESIEQALNFCRQLSSEITTDDVFAIPSELPASQFGFESAWSEVTSRVQVNEFQIAKPINFSALLPSGSSSLNRWQTLWNQGYRTFKWKIGVAPISEEIKTFHKLTNVLPQEAKLRLDANAGLNEEATVQWLQACEGVNVEFLEQPLPVNKFTSMLQLSQQFSTLLALDESVANIQQLQTCYQQGWRGIFVIKPAIFGSPKQLRKFCQQNQIDTVFSTVFETQIGRHQGLKLSAEIAKNQRAPGYGVAHWFLDNDIFSQIKTSAYLPYENSKLMCEKLWAFLSNT